MLPLVASALACVGGAAHAGKSLAAPGVDDLASVYQRAAEEVGQANADVQATAEAIYHGKFADAVKTTAAPPQQGDDGGRRSRGEYRPFAERFDLKPRGGSKASRMWPENRKSYQGFEASFPGHPVQPNHHDRDVETTVLVLVIVTALATVIVGSLAGTRLGTMSQLEDQLEGFFLILMSPALLATLCLYYVALANFSNPIRTVAGLDQDHPLDGWSCHALIWYLLLMPILTLLNVTSQLTMLISEHRRMRHKETTPSWQSGEHFTRSMQSRAEMTDIERAREKLQKAHLAAQRLVTYRDTSDDLVFRQALMLFNFIGLGCGFYLTGFGENTCLPEVWWAALAFTVVTTTVLIVCILAVLASACLLVSHSELAACWEAMSSQYGSVFHEGVQEQPFAMGSAVLAPAAPEDSPSGPLFGTVVISEGGPPPPDAPTLSWETGYGTLDGTLPPAASLPVSAQRIHQGAMY